MSNFYQPIIEALLQQWLETDLIHLGSLSPSNWVKEYSQSAWAVYRVFGPEVAGAILN
mgnify:CR=1 FL=1